MPYTPERHHSPEAIANGLATRLTDSLFQLDDEARRILRDALVESIAETLLPSLQALFRPQFRSKFHGGKPSSSKETQVMFDHDFCNQLHAFLDNQADVTESGTPNEAMHLLRQLERIKPFTEEDLAFSEAFAAYQEMYPKIPTPTKIFRDAYYIGRGNYRKLQDKYNSVEQKLSQTECRAKAPKS